ncbi:MAG: hypothetical protein ABIF09_00745 [Gemmatimonadota bacterium]
MLRSHPLRSHPLLYTLLIGIGLLGSLLVAGPVDLQADGGTLRAANVPMGAYRVSVFTDPTPVGPDSIDVSVLVTFERGRGVATGLEIEVVGRRVDGTGEEIRHPATRDQAIDPRYYAAKFALGSEGLWELRVRVKGPEGEGETGFQLSVREPGLLGNPYLILTAALLPLLLVGWWLKRSSLPSTHPGD